MFPWTNSRIKELAGLPPDATIPGTDEDNRAFHRAHELYMLGGNAKKLRDKVVAIHMDQNAAWKELTGFHSALGTPRAWRAAARRAEVPSAALDTMTVETMAEHITEWALSLPAIGADSESVQLAGVPVEASEQELKERQVSGAELENPKSYLLSWREIVEALDLKPNEASRDQIRSLNEKYSGPITIGGRGKQPKATRENLLKWWNGLESRFEENQARDRDKQATVDNQYKHGRDETVVPDISGHVKKRRGK